MLFQDQDFQKLLLLHSRDRRHQKLKIEIDGLPDELDRLDQRIAVEDESIEMALNELKELERMNLSLEKDLCTLTESISTLKDKQLKVKKNEEYQALQKQIETSEEKIPSKENQQLEVLMRIDDAKETARIAQSKIQSKLDELRLQRDSRIRQIDSRKAEWAELKAEIESTRQEIPPDFLSAYDRVSKIVSAPPYMAPLSDQKCSGCHLRVSNDVVSSVLVEKKITHCDQCGRIVYVER